MRAKKSVLDKWYPDESANNHINGRNFYNQEDLDGFVDDDMISNAEEGFMIGYLDA